jgi:hypothetical protein
VVSRNLPKCAIEEVGPRVADVEPPAHGSVDSGANHGTSHGIESRRLKRSVVDGPIRGSERLNARNGVVQVLGPLLENLKY